MKKPHLELLLHVAILAGKKAKSGHEMRRKIDSYSYSSHDTIFRQQKSEIRSGCISWKRHTDGNCSHNPIFSSEKVKIFRVKM